VTFDKQTGWVDLYHAALLEVDYQKLPELLRLTESAIQAKLDTLSAPLSIEELSAIQDARQNLRVLQRELEAHESSTTDRIAHSHSEIAGDYVAFVDAGRRYVEVTDGVCRLLGYRREELLTKTIDDVTAPELRLDVPETFRQYVAKGGLEGQFCLLAKDGRRIPIRYQAKVYPDGCRVARWELLSPQADALPEDFRNERAS
jgi:PAS domain S-box-containing protein